MRLAVCGWRAIIKGISRTAFSCFHALLENIVFAPEFFCFFFAVYEIQIRGYFLIHLRFPPVYCFFTSYACAVSGILFLFPTRNPCCFASAALTCFWISRACGGRLRHLHCTPQCASPRSVSCVMSHYTRKPRPVKGRGNISETTCYCILTYDLYAPVVTRRIRQNLLIFDLSACNSEVIFNHLLLAPVLHRHRLALPFTNDLLSSS